MAAFLLWPLAVLQLVPHVLHRTLCTLTPKETPAA